LNAVVVNSLTKVYQSKMKALNSIDISVEKGEIFGFLGPNGAGKTTAVKILNGMLQRTSGSCSIFGFDPEIHPEKVHNLSGVVTEHARMYDNLSGIQNLLFYASLFGIPTNEAKARAMKILDNLSLLEPKERKLSEYSTGMRQRLSLARALMHKPKILFLDEPTSGLDPESAQSVNNMIKTLSSEEGITVFLCTHQLRYAEEVCTKYGLLYEGNILATGTLSELRSFALSGLSVIINADCYPPELEINLYGNNKLFDIACEDEVPQLVKKIVDFGGKISHVEMQKPSLEELYFKLLEKHRKES